MKKVEKRSSGAMANIQYNVPGQHKENREQSEAVVQVRYDCALTKKIDVEIGEERRCQRYLGVGMIRTDIYF